MKTKERLGGKDTVNAAGRIQGVAFFHPPSHPSPTSARHVQRSARVQVLTLGHTWPLPPSTCTAFMGSSWCSGATPVPTPPPPHPQISVCDTQGPGQQPCPSHTHSPSLFSRPFLRTDTIVFFLQDKYLNHFGKFPPTHTQHTYVWIGNPICKQIC